MVTRIGQYEQQPAGYKAFVPFPFPPVETISLSSATAIKHAEAMHLLGKLDGVAKLLPDRDFFLLMFFRKEASSSSQIEGTRATMTDAIEAEVVPRTTLPPDVDDILYYIKALNYGLNRFTTLPLSVRFVCELHDELMKGARATQHPFPGEFRRTQNWIRGTSPGNAHFVPPPPHEIARSMSDLEKFIHSKKDTYPPLVKAALIHAQFETIHPFIDGNGRTGRLLITMYLCQEKLLEVPILYLSDFFKKHQNTYYDRLQGYHNDPAEIEAWIDFFLEGICTTAHSEIEIAYKIDELYRQDMAKIQTLGKTAVISAKNVLRHLYTQPIVTVAKIQEWTGFTRAGAQKVIDRLIMLNILIQKDVHKIYGRTYEYHFYLSLFQNNNV